MKTYYNILTLLTILSVVQTSAQEVQPSYEIIGTIPGAVEPQFIVGDMIVVIKEETICTHALKRDLPLVNCTSNDLIEIKHYLSGPEDLTALVFIAKDNPTKYHLKVGKYLFESDEEIVPIDFYFGRIGNFDGRSWLCAKKGTSASLLNYDSSFASWHPLGIIDNKNEFCLTPTHACADFTSAVGLWYLKQAELVTIPYASPCKDITKIQTIRPIAYNNKHNLLVTPALSDDFVRSIVQLGRPEDECFNGLYDHKEVINYLASVEDIVCAAGIMTLTIADINTGTVMQTIAGNFKDITISPDAEFIAAHAQLSNVVVVWKRKD